MNKFFLILVLLVFSVKAKSNFKYNKNYFSQTKKVELKKPTLKMFVKDSFSLNKNLKFKKIFVFIYKTEEIPASAGIATKLSKKKDPPAACCRSPGKISPVAGLIFFKF